MADKTVRFVITATADHNEEDDPKAKDLKEFVQDLFIQSYLKDILNGKFCGEKFKWKSTLSNFRFDPGVTEEDES